MARVIAHLKEALRRLRLLFQLFSGSSCRAGHCICNTVPAAVARTNCFHSNITSEDGTHKCEERAHQPDKECFYLGHSFCLSVLFCLLPKNLHLNTQTSGVLVLFGTDLQRCELRLRTTNVGKCGDADRRGCCVCWYNPSLSVLKLGWRSRVGLKGVVMGSLATRRRHGFRICRDATLRATSSTA